MLRIVASHAQEAARLLLSKGFVLSMTPVLAVAVPDEPGGLARLLDLVVKENIDIEYMYSMFGQKDGMAYMIFRVEDIKGLEALFQKEGVSFADPEDLGIN